ncbi:uncharacterized protein BKA55DRAFT_731934 [Fusarium redolens]|uniref:Uncharacterized protein n=1 Tax=Fusarium redolens TaxID=48865 RepID=A0A9P9KVW6_FUSRE|nr:uncharacterized protein BKA55DRAFT_731934 [Fusarium redolens]KAH7269730.1 hypothetical protein BKA55DRAFT_731934 [Fusarium redolens]
MPAKKPCSSAGPNLLPTTHLKGTLQSPITLPLQGQPKPVYKRPRRKLTTAPSRCLSEEACSHPIRPFILKCLT